MFNTLRSAEKASVESLQDLEISTVRERKHYKSVRHFCKRW